MSDSIPKVIHYCWFGGRPHPAPMVRYLDSWRRILPDYRIVEWNETNFDVESSPYTSEAYRAGKFAFVTDYVRLKVLLDYGGVYMDTDVQVLRSFDKFLRHEAFSGFESPEALSTAVMGARVGSPWIHALLADYDGQHFGTEEDGLDLTTNVERISRTMVNRFNVRLDNSFQEIPGIVTLYPADYFCAKDYRTGAVQRTRNTHAIHHFAGSWHSDEQRNARRMRQRLTRLLGARAGTRVMAVVKVLQQEGLGSLVKAIRTRLGAHRAKAPDA